MIYLVLVGYPQGVAISAFRFKELFLRRGRRVGGKARSLEVTQLVEYQTVNLVAASSILALENFWSGSTVVVAHGC